MAGLTKYRITSAQVYKLYCLRPLSEKIPLFSKERFKNSDGDRRQYLSITTSQVPNQSALTYLLARLLIKSSTTVGSANVEVSPNVLISLAAILRKIRRMILPERVFGRPGAH